MDLAVVSRVVADECPVLTVYVVWHQGCSRAAAFARSIFTALCADPTIPASRGLGIPVRFRTSTGCSEVPVPIVFKGAQHTVVIVLADDVLVADPAWRQYVDGLAGSTRDADRVIPVAITDARNLPPGLSPLQAIRLKPAPEKDQEMQLINEVMHDLCRLLDSNAAKVKVFLSHAKQDGLRITRTVRRYLHETARLDEFFDTDDLSDGKRFADQITEAAGSLPALLAVQTDTYASREWCRLEVLEAKRHYVPIVVLSAVKQSVGRSFPYMGNVPVVRWHNRNSLPGLVRALLTEVLRSRYFPLRAEALFRFHGIVLKPKIFVYPPELLTVLTYRLDMIANGDAGAQYLYPDPPLGTEELQLIHQLDPNIDPVTPTMIAAL